MKTYRVEEMAGETPVSHYTVIATTPWEAATIGTKREVKARSDERLWVRVSEEGKQAVFRYTFK